MSQLEAVVAAARGYGERLFLTPAMHHKAVRWYAGKGLPFPADVLKVDRPIPTGGEAKMGDREMEIIGWVLGGIFLAGVLYAAWFVWNAKRGGHG